MRKLWMAGAIAAVALAAQGARADDAAKERREAADATKAEMKKDAREARAEAKEMTKEAQAEAKEKAREAKAEAAEKSAEARSEMKQEGEEVRASSDRKADEARGEMGRERDAAYGTQASRHEKKHPLFDGKDNFKVDGKIQKVSADSITLAREELPAATLKISTDTKVELDGKQVSATQLKQGQDVKASFNLRDDKPEAVEIKAEKADDQKSR